MENRNNKREAEDIRVKRRIKRRSIPTETPEIIEEIKQIKAIETDDEVKFMEEEEREYLIYKGTPPRNLEEAKKMIERGMASWELTTDQDMLNPKEQKEISDNITLKMENGEMDYTRLKFIQYND